MEMNLITFRDRIEHRLSGTPVTREDMLYVVDALVDLDEWREKTDHVISWLVCAVYVLAGAIIVWAVAR